MICLVLEKVIWLIRGSCEIILSASLSNVIWQCGSWPHTGISSADQTLHYFLTLLPNWSLLRSLNFYWILEVSMKHLQSIFHNDRERWPLRTPGLAPFVTCMCSNAEIISCFRISKFCYSTGFLLYNVDHAHVYVCVDIHNYLFHDLLTF